MIAGYGLPEHLRITIGTESEVRRCAIRCSASSPQANDRPRQPMFDKIALIGIGLIGGSIALDARSGGLAKKIVAATRSAETGDDRQPAEAGRPLRHRSRGRLRGRRPGDRLHAGRRLRRGRPQAIAPTLKPGCIVSDVGSVKQAVIDDMGPHIPARRAFRAGPSGRRHGEFRPRGGASSTCSTGRWSILTPLPDGDRRRGRQARGVLEGAGQRGQPARPGQPRPHPRHHLAPAASDRLHHRRHGRRSRRPSQQRGAAASPPAASATSPASPRPIRRCGATCS